MLRRIRARNFRSFTDLQSPEFAHVNVILGPNGAGKSSIKDAIAVLLSGTATGYETGIGLEGLKTIGSMAKRWQLDAQLGDATITRTTDEGPRSAKQSSVEQLTGVLGAKARACIESGELVRLDLKSRQRLLQALAPRATVTLPPAIKTAVLELLGEDRTDVELADIDRLYKAAYDERAQASRDVKVIGDLEAPAAPEGFDGLAPNEIDAELVDVRAQLRALRQERDDAITNAAPKATDTKPYQDAVAKTTRELEDVQAAIAGLPTMSEIGQKAQDLVRRISDLEATNTAIESSRVALKEQLGAAEGAMKTAKAALEAVKAQHGEVGCCPVCDSKLTKTNRGKLEVSLKNKYEAAGRDWQRINVELQSTTQPKSAADLNRESDALQAKESRLAGLLEDEKRLGARLLEEQEALQVAGDAPADPGDPDAAGKAMELADRISNGEKILEDLVAYAAARTAHETNVGRKATAMKKHVALEQLVADLGPTGIRTNCGNAGMFAFHEDLNALLKPRGFIVDLRPAMDAEGDPIITVRGRPTPLPMLSEGERLAFGAAFACAVASVTKLGIVVVDNFERLDPEAHEAVLGMLAASPHQSFVLSVERDEGMEAIAADVNAENGGMRMFLIRDGQLVAPGLDAAAKETAA